MTDKVINVPINDEDIAKTINMLPRTPKEAGLIGIALKRKLEYKKSHNCPLVNPTKIFNMLHLLKDSGNPYYQFYNDVHSFKDRCKTDDPEGFELLFPDDLEEVLMDVNDACCSIVEDEMTLPHLAEDDAHKTTENEDEELKDEMS